MSAASTNYIRSYLTRGRIVGQLIFTGILLLVAMALIVLFALTLPLPMAWLAPLAVVLWFGALIYLGTRHDYRWVELDGNTLRAQHLYTGGIVTRDVSEVESLNTMLFPGESLEGVVIQAILGRIKGIEISFADRKTPLRVYRADPAMVNAAELIAAVYQALAQQSQLAVEMTQQNNQPVVSKIYRQETPPEPEAKPNIALVTLTPMILSAGAILFGMILGYIWAQESDRSEVVSVAPHELTAAALIANGPGENRHIVLTGFQPAGYAYEEQKGRWIGGWVALFPINGDTSKIEIVYSSKAAQSPNELLMPLKHGRVIGICSAQRSTSWGLTLGPNLRKANNDAQLVSAWNIDESGPPTSPENLRLLWIGSVSMFSVAGLLALLSIWLGSR